MKRSPRMRQRRTRARFIWAAGLTAAALLIAGLYTSRGVEAALAVIDNGNLAQNATTAARTADMLVKMTEQLTELEAVSDAFGLKGAFEKTGDLEGILHAGTGAVKRVIGRTKSLGSIKGNLNVLDDIAKMVNVGSGLSDIADYQSAVRAVRDVVQVVGASKQQLTQAEEDRLVAGRRWFAEEANVESVGMALLQRQSASETPEVIGDIAKAARGAETVREQMAVNTAALLAVTQELAMLRGLVAVQVQAQGATYFRQNPPDGFRGMTFDAAPSDTGEVQGVSVFR